MKYFLILVLFIVGCSKKNDPEPQTPKHNPIYTQIKGTWYNADKSKGLQTHNYSSPEDSILVVDWVQTNQNKVTNTLKYYINQEGRLYTQQSGSNGWAASEPIKIVNDTLIIDNGNIAPYKYHR